MFQEIHNTYMLGAPGEYTIDQYQILCPSMKWLEFIKNVVGPTVNVSKDDQVVFPPPQTLNSWLDLISKTVKRYMVAFLKTLFCIKAIMFVGHKPTI